MVRSRWRRWVDRLIPLPKGPSEIPALDGLRAVAALSVLVFHAVESTAETPRIAGHDLAFAANFLQTGVHLFFVLSGFLLFRPYARAILGGRPLPSAREFYRRRAWRTWPAYWVCLGILVVAHLKDYLSFTGAANVGSHLLFVHDVVPAFVQSINAPFWTLAVEWQFYLVIPLLAAGVARVARGSRKGLLLGVALVIAGAFVLRGLDLVGMTFLPRLDEGPRTVLAVVAAVTFGWRGKYLEVFGLGMLCAALYVLTVDGRATPARPLRWVGVVLFPAGLATLGALAYVQPVLPGLAGELLLQFQPGAGYAMVLLSLLWSGPLVRFVFESWPLRAVGLISYSLYLWHDVFVFNLLPLTDGLNLKARVLVAFIVAFLSFQLVERPFLPRRRSPAAGIPVVRPGVAAPVAVAVE